MSKNDHSKVLAIIAASEDESQLRRFMANAESEGAAEVRAAAFRRLVEIRPEAAPGTIEHDFWRTIFAFEEVLREERGKTVLLSRTRQKVKRAGVRQTLIDFAMSKRPTEGFTMLLERDMPELTGEAIILRHAAHFDEAVLRVARERLVSAGVDIEKLPRR